MPVAAATCKPNCSVMCGSLMVQRLRKISGFGLIELTVVIIIVGILVAVAMQSATVIVQDARRVETEREMEMLADAIVGDPAIICNGQRADFGYVGDVGSFPANLQALYESPGGYSTWDGPYVLPGLVQDSVGFKMDEWGSLYNYSGGVTITSTGSGSTITKKIADAVTDYTLNTLNGTIIDANDSVPGTVYLDSVDIKITIPDGGGGATTKAYMPDSAGLVTLDSLPAGTHPLRMIYTPNVDTLLRYVTILPRHKSPVSYKFASAYFGGGGGGGGGSDLAHIAGRDTVYSSPQCRNFSFWVINNSGSQITVNSITLIYATPTAYYRYVRWGSTTVFDSNSPKNGSGDVASFSSSQSVNDGDSARVRIETFKNSTTGGSNVDMSNVDVTVLLSDGSTFDISFGACP